MKKLLLLALVAQPVLSHADENLFGYVKGAEPMPSGAREIKQVITSRQDKGAGHYNGMNYNTEFEAGITDRFTATASLNLQGMDTKGIRIDAYIPQDEKYSLKFAGVEGSVKYNFLSAAANPIGISSYSSLNIGVLDAHSGLDKNTYSFEQYLLLQKYLMDGQLVWAGNIGIEATHATRKAVANLPPDFEWPVHPEMEIALQLATGLSYRVAPNWYVGAETVYASEYETVVGQERWSLFAGPSVHYGDEKWWVTATWFPQIRGGKSTFPEQDDKNLQLVERTKNEYRLKIGFNF